MKLQDASGRIMAVITIIRPYFITYPKNKDQLHFIKLRVLSLGILEKSPATVKRPGGQLVFTPEDGCAIPNFHQVANLNQGHKAHFSFACPRELLRR